MRYVVLVISLLIGVSHQEIFTMQPWQRGLRENLEKKTLLKKQQPRQSLREFFSRRIVKPIQKKVEEGIEFLTGTHLSQEEMEELTSTTLVVDLKKFMDEYVAKNKAELESDSDKLAYILVLLDQFEKTREYRTTYQDNKFAKNMLNELGADLNVWENYGIEIAPYLRKAILVSWRKPILPRVLPLSKETLAEINDLKLEVYADYLFGQDVKKITEDFRNIKEWLSNPGVRADFEKKNPYLVSILKQKHNLDLKSNELNPLEQKIVQMVKEREKISNLPQQIIVPQSNNPPQLQQKLILEQQQPKKNNELIFQETFVDFPKRQPQQEQLQQQPQQIEQELEQFLELKKQSQVQNPPEVKDMRRRALGKLEDIYNKGKSEGEKTTIEIRDIKSHFDEKWLSYLDQWADDLSKTLLKSVVQDKMNVDWVKKMLLYLFKQADIMSKVSFSIASGLNANATGLYQIIVDTNGLNKSQAQGILKRLKRENELLEQAYQKQKNEDYKSKSISVLRPKAKPLSSELYLQKQLSGFLGAIKELYNSQGWVAQFEGTLSKDLSYTSISSLIDTLELFEKDILNSSDANISSKQRVDLQKLAYMQGKIITTYFPELLKNEGVSLFRLRITTTDMDRYVEEYLPLLEKQTISRADARKIIRSMHIINRQIAEEFIKKATEIGKK
jgi:hypothetical protein